MCINYFVECIVDIYFELCEIKEGISYFHKQYIKRDKELKNIYNFIISLVKNIVTVYMLNKI